MDVLYPFCEWPLEHFKNFFPKVEGVFLLGINGWQSIYTVKVKDITETINLFLKAKYKIRVFSLFLRFKTMEDDLKEPYRNT